MEIKEIPQFTPLKLYTDVMKAMFIDTIALESF